MGELVAKCRMCIIYYVSYSWGPKCQLGTMGFDAPWDFSVSDVHGSGGPQARPQWLNPCMYLSIGALAVLLVGASTKAHAHSLWTTPAIAIPWATTAIKCDPYPYPLVRRLHPLMDGLSTTTI